MVLPMIPQEFQFCFLPKALLWDLTCMLWMEVDFGWRKMMKGQEKFKGKIALLNTSVFMEFGNIELTTET